MDSSGRPDPNSQYRLGPDSLPHPGVPKGKSADLYVYPEQGVSRHPAYLLGLCSRPIRPGETRRLDGVSVRAGLHDPNGDLRAQNVMDNLIYRREIPVMIGVFIIPVAARSGRAEPGHRRLGRPGPPTGSPSTTPPTTSMPG